MEAPVSLVVDMVAELEVVGEELEAEDRRATQGAGVGGAQGPRQGHLGQHIQFLFFLIFSFKF